MNDECQAYYTCVSRTLHAALCIGNYPSRAVERHNKPEVEVNDCTSDTGLGKSPEFLLNPIRITRSEHESCFIEPSINSVRVSFSFLKTEALADLISRKYVSFLAQRGQEFRILRKRPVSGYDISFLITHEDVETIPRGKIIQFMITFLMEIDEDIRNLKMNANERARRAASEIFKAMALN
uniref:WGS project CAEQ00000000 data, annotated contig 1170 n=1 Tax=Trypanosoma congolense (strain IL3000) TaxID=1068625 RepID=F9W4D0_TRYCI|nr:unnamed protein product [Trypanosoma congolense IL3000]